MKLYEIPIVAEEIERELFENMGELTPDLEAKINAFLAEGADKMEAAAMVVKSLEGDAEVCKFEAKRLNDRAASLEANADRLKKLMVFALDTMFNGKLKTAKFTLWNQTSASTVSFALPPDADLVELASAYDWAFRVRDPELDKIALKEAFKAGKKLPETIIATENPGTRFLRIK